METVKERLWNRNFVKVCFGNFMLYFSFYLIMPLLPLYLHDTFNASEQMIGIVLAGYTVTALVIRPFGGYMVDSFPRKTVLMICYFAFFAFFAGYFLAWTVLLFAIIRTLHGFAFGSTTVAFTRAAVPRG
jgi:MFS family permease